ncbi:PCRF domain-containing protein, partial [Thermomonas sp.]|uniref:PCRF domain-containing protein n=1 Tax=Thermomonas sp. TaxID=1971895 RepID=UPI0025F15E6E
MLLRMYLRWAEARLEDRADGSQRRRRGRHQVRHLPGGGDYAYGWLKTEIGVHRLVRRSPFDSDNRRHTSFTSVFVSPEVDD